MFFFSLPQQAGFVASAGVGARWRDDVLSIIRQREQKIFYRYRSLARRSSAWVAATADLLGMLFRSMKIMKEIMDFPFSKLLAYTT